MTLETKILFKYTEYKIRLRNTIFENKENIHIFINLLQEYLYIYIYLYYVQS